MNLQQLLQAGPVLVMDEPGELVVQLRGEYLYLVFCIGLDDWTEIGFHPQTVPGDIRANELIARAQLYLAEVHGAGDCTLGDVA